MAGRHGGRENDARGRGGDEHRQVCGVVIEKAPTGRGHGLVHDAATITTFDDAVNSRAIRRVSVAMG
jgi:hypothetical protein